MVILGIRIAIRVDGKDGYLDHPIGNSLTSLILVMLRLADLFRVAVDVLHVSSHND